MAADVAEPEGVFKNIQCEGVYKGHLQGICTDDKAFVFWSFTDVLVKTDRDGKIVKKIPVASHHGDLCYQNGKIYVAVNLGKFNDAQGHADSWVYVYDAADLRELAKHPVPEVFYGAGGIGCRERHFFVVGGLPEGINENYIYEYDADFKFIKQHVLESGYTLMGIQTATFSGGFWWFGCYGQPKVMLKTDASFNMVGKYLLDCSLGVVGLPDGSLLIADNIKAKDHQHTGSARIADADAEKGFVIRTGKSK
jgi:hypothetical protein